MFCRSTKVIGFLGITVVATAALHPVSVSCQEPCYVFEGIDCSDVVSPHPTCEYHECIPQFDNGVVYWECDSPTAEVVQDNVVSVMRHADPFMWGNTSWTTGATITCSKQSVCLCNFELSISTGKCERDDTAFEPNEQQFADTIADGDVCYFDPYPY